MRRLLVLIGFILFASFSARAQTFNSGSTGADGPLDLTSGDRTVQLPESGVLNYTTVNIPAGKTLTFARNSRNTPVYMLAQGNVTISGTINVAAPVANAPGSFPNNPRLPGPGGFYGGQSNQPGFGPGGGQADGSWIGPLSLVPIIGGSGGSGIGGTCGSGGGGGGAIVIASSTSILTVSNSRIDASGAQWFPGGCSSTRGSGGAIRLVANNLSLAGDFRACINGGSNPPCGVIRFEAPSGSLTFAGSAVPPAVLSPINPAVVSGTPPLLTMVSIGGFAVPSGSGLRFDTIDLLLPSQLVDPIPIVVQANNIPVGTQVVVGIINGSPSAISNPGTLQGTFSSSTASPTISNLNRTAVTYLLASATFDPPPGSGPSNEKGANHVEKVRIESLFGAKPRYVFLRKDGTVINPELLSKQFLAQFGE